MKRLLLTLATPAENLALDEALLDWAEATDPSAEFLRLWEPNQPFVVVGRATRLHEEVALDECSRRAVPVLRRSSGGATIVAGPGCLMYALVLSYDLRPELRDIGRAHEFVLTRLGAAIRRLGANVSRAGTSDLVVAEGVAPLADRDSKIRHPNPPETGPRPRKFSGNSMRAKRTHLLYHGTLLYDFDFALMGSLLKMPPRQPDYRAARSHDDFLTNLPLSRATLEEAVVAAWPTSGELVDWPRKRVADLVAERFASDAWNHEFA